VVQPASIPPTLLSQNFYWAFSSPFTKRKLGRQPRQN